MNPTPTQKLREDATYRKDHPPIEELREHFHYDPKTGAITWIKDRPFNKVCGLPAGKMKTDGYLHVKYGRRWLLQHRLAWALHYGEWPQQYLDHINGIRDDNRIENLRLADRGQNNRNARLRKDNKTGFKGVGHATGNRFYAQIRHQGKQKRLGIFNSAEEAHAAYVTAAKQLHGEFANAGSGIQGGK